MQRLVMVSLLLLTLQTQAQLIQHKSQRLEYHVVGMVPFPGPKFVQQYAPAFGHYLTQKVGTKFDPAINFTIRFEDAYTLEPFDEALANKRDFAFVTPNIAGCLEAEFLQTALCTVRNYRGGRELNHYGGVIFALANRTDIQTVRDLKDKVITASNFKLTQFQWRVFEDSGVSLMADTKQIRFSSKGEDEELQKDILNGIADAAFTRTDSLETWALNNPSSGPKPFKVVSPVTPAPELEGKPFPWEISSELYPEYGLMAGFHVEWEIRREIMKALFEVNNKTVVCDAMYCNVNSSTGQYMNAKEDDPQVQRILKMLKMKYADWIKSPDVVAKKSKVDAATGLPSDAGCCVNIVRAAEIASFQPALSYGPARDLFQTLGLMNLDPKKRRWSCLRAADYFDGISCPAGMFKKSKKEVLAGCKEYGQSCPADRYDMCLCRPCKRAEEVEVSIQFVNGVLVNQRMAESLALNASGCEKMTVCGSFRQNDEIVYKVTDNRLRPEMTLTWSLRAGIGVPRTGVGVSRVVDYEKEKGSEFDFKYSFNVSSRFTGLHILEIYLDGIHVPVSPLLLDVKSAICADENTVANEDGECRCDLKRQLVPAGGGKCIHVGVLVVVVVLPLSFVMAVLAYLWKDLLTGTKVQILTPEEDQLRVTKKADVLWEINFNDLVFDDPPEVLGRGTFGLVLAATYNTTSVAVKRVIPSHSEQYRRMDIFGSLLHLSPQSGQSSSKSSSIALSASSGTDSSASFRTEDTPKDARRARKKLSLQEGTVTSKPMNTGLQTTMSTTTLKDHRTLFQRIFPCLHSEHAMQRKNFIEEMRFLSKMRHPCITTVMGAVVASDREPMLVMECMEYGSLHDLIHNHTMVLNGELVIPLLVDVCQGLMFLHSSKPPIIHGDLKAANVLVDSKFCAKVADFGALSGKKAIGACGTPFWMAPELLLGHGNSLQSDVYAFGIMVWEVYARQDPYMGQDPDVVLNQVKLATPEKRPEIPVGSPFQVQDIMKAAWHNDPTVRPAFSELEKMLRRLDTNSMGPRVNGGADLQDANGLLNDVFPKHISDKLRKGEKIEPEHRECVTIFFSDIVGFTDICSMIDAGKVSHMLDRLYTAFDALSSEHRIFKVGTIGDAYMAVTNLVEDQPNDHALRIALFAFHAIEAANSTLIDPQRPEMGTIKIRVGFHSGPVVANVVGTRNQKYCLFGDTVNTASRMESNSEPGRIHCSDAAAKILKQQISLADLRTLHVSCRGEIPIKGKGTMTTHWVSRGKLESLPLLPLPATLSISSLEIEHPAATFGMA